MSSLQFMRFSEYRVSADSEQYSRCCDSCTDLFRGALSSPQTNFIDVFVDGIVYEFIISG